MKQLFKFLKMIIRENPLSAILACIIGAVVVLSSTGLFGLSAYLIALAALHPSFDAVAVPVVGVRFFGIARAVFRYLERLVSHDTTFRVLLNLRVEVYKNAEPLFPDYKEKLRREDVISRLVSDVENLQEAFLRIIYPYLTAILVLISGFIILLAFNSLLALAFSVLYSITIFFIPYLLNKTSKGIWSDAANVKQKLFGTFIEFSYGLVEILSNKRERTWENKLNDILEKDLEYGAKSAATLAFSNALAYMFPALSMWSCLFISCWLVSNGVLPGQLVAVAPLISSALFEAAQPVTSIGARLGKSTVSAERVFNMPKTNIWNQNGVSLPNIKGNKIEIENLCFGYDNENPVIKNFDLSLKKGEIKALAGKSGIGKSTVVNILLGFLDGYTGKIQIDGVDLQQADPDQWRKLFSVVDQKPFFFNTTIRDNMKIAKPAATDDEIFDALHKAGVDELVGSLPRGLDTVISELGSNVSGGELQRLTIARAILKDAPFFIFDEPTEGLDMLNEKNIMDLIMSLCESKGILLITHKKYMLNQMNEVYYLT